MFSSLFNSFTRLLKNRRDQPISVNHIVTNNAESINNLKETQKVVWDIKSKKKDIYCKSALDVDCQGLRV